MEQKSKFKVQQNNEINVTSEADYAHLAIPKPENNDINLKLLPKLNPKHKE